MSEKKPGIIDPPLNPQDSFTLKTWMQQITEAVREGMGQIGEVGQGFVRFDDLVAGGFLSPINPRELANTDSLIGDVYTNEAVEEAQSYDLTPPAAVNGLSASPQTGAILLDWTPPMLTYPHYFEIWRSTTASQDDRVLYGTTSALRYSDINVSNDAPYTYWVRTVKTVASELIYGPFDSVSGVTATSYSTDTNILEVVGEGMYIKTPDGQVNPFTYYNKGTEDSPQWLVALRAEVAIQGRLAISQLDGGELDSGAALTIGNSSISMDTRTDGSGQIVVTGTGGITANDYLVLNQGTLASYVWNGSEHVQYKEVRRIERGVSQSGQLVSIPAWFKSQPTVYLAPFTVPTYNPDYPTQGQQWRLTHSQVEPNPNESGGWVFTPLAQLELTEGNATQVYPDKTYHGSSNDHEAVIPRRTSLNSLRVNARCASIRSTGTAGNFYNRKVEVTLWYKVYGTTTWLFGKKTSVNINQNNTANIVIDFDVPSVGDYDLKISYTASDSGGTYSTGTEYQYTTRTVDASPASMTISSPQWGYINATPPSLSGWSVYETQWYYKMAGWVESSGAPDYKRGYINYPNGSLYSDFDFTTTSSFSGSQTSISFYAGNMGFYDAGVTVSNATATFKYRKPISNSTSPDNAFFLDSIEYNQGAQIINPTSEEVVLNWLAVGE